MTTISTDTGLYVIRDADGNVIAKADVPPGEHPTTDDADPTKSFDVDDDLTIQQLESKLSESPRNVPDHVYDRVPNSARGLLDSAEVDNKYRGPE